ncbi:MAG: hypothetical protein AAFP90_16435, partial [Planctomycetota bacterium]
WPARWIFGIGASLVIGLLVLNFDAAIRWFDTGLRENDRAWLVEVDEDAEQQVYTGTLNRLFVVQIYGPLVLRGGPLGYGSQATSDFPPNIPGLPGSTRSRRILSIVDNSYILNGLRLGIVGLAIFIALIAAGVYTAFSMRHVASTFFHPFGSQLMIGLAIGLILLAAQIFTVYWAYDFAFWVLFQLGAVAGLAASSRLIVSGALPEDHANSA